MPNIVGPWLAGIFDSDKSAARAAHTSFQLVFRTEEKIKSVWIVYLGSILQYCSDVLFKETENTLSDERTTSPDNAAAKYARVATAAIYTIRQIIGEPTALLDCNVTWFLTSSRRSP